MLRHYCANRDETCHLIKLLLLATMYDLRENANYEAGALDGVPCCNANRLEICPVSDHAPIVVVFAYIVHREDEIACSSQRPSAPYFPITYVAVTPQIFSVQPSSGAAEVNGGAAVVGAAQESTGQ